MQRLGRCPIGRGDRVLSRVALDEVEQHCGEGLLGVPLLPAVAQEVRQQPGETVVLLVAQAVERASRRFEKLGHGRRFAPLQARASFGQAPTRRAPQLPGATVEDDVLAAACLARNQVAFLDLGVGKVLCQTLLGPSRQLLPGRRQVAVAECVERFVEHRVHQLVRALDLLVEGHQTGRTIEAGAEARAAQLPLQCDETRLLAKQIDDGLEVLRQRLDVRIEERVEDLIDRLHVAGKSSDRRFFPGVADQDEAASLPTSPVILVDVPLRGLDGAVQRPGALGWSQRFG